MPIEKPRPDPEEFLERVIRENGYVTGRVVNDRLAFVICAYGSFFALLLCEVGDYTGSLDRWDYGSFVEAFVGMTECDGATEPKGWYRNPTRGRRISRSPDEWDQDGKKVGGVGIEYINW